jgi:hypothetical protein
MVQNPKRTGFVEARFATRQKGNSGSLNLKFETGTRIQIVNACTEGEPSAKIYLPSCFLFGGIQKRPILPRIAHVQSAVILVNPSHSEFKFWRKERRVKEGGGEVGERERERAFGVRLRHSRQ